MKKYALIGFLMMLLIGTSVYAIPNKDYKQLSEINDFEQIGSPFTHTVFAEQCTATWCPNCPTASQALNNLYESGNYSFFYVSLVDDKNSIAKKRNFEYSFGFYKGYAFPTVYFDGGDANKVGRGKTYQETEDEYRSLIEKVGKRKPRQPITMESSVKWNGNGKLTVTVSITNTGNFLYLGKIRSYVTEIESRWKDKSRFPYHFGFLDYAINRYILLMPGKTKTITRSFDGAADHGGQTYEDITSDNIMVISTISHWFPHYRIGYKTDNFTQRYFARFVDQTTAATPT